MESLPSLQSLHQALTSEDAIEAEEELLSVISHLLVCAIEDPGIPNPNRHTTLLGQTLRTADITNSNLSEILRIYLYAVATGEVRSQTGVTLDRERERRVADHHQVDSEQMVSVGGKNQAYYEHLQQNHTWKLSECLKDKPYVALNPTVKTEILAHLCNDLLLNKAVVKQIEGSLDAMAQHKRERYLFENRVRKYKHLHARKLRMEQFEKQQLLAKQQMLHCQMQAQQSNATQSQLPLLVQTPQLPQQQQQQLLQFQQQPSATQNTTLQETAADQTQPPQSTQIEQNATAAEQTETQPEESESTLAATEDVSAQNEIATVTNNNNESISKVDTSSTLIKNPSNLTNASSTENLTDVSELNNHKEDSVQSSDVVLSNKTVDITDSPMKNMEEIKPIKIEDFNSTDTSRILNNGATTPDISNLLNKKIINTNDSSTADVILDDELSDIESEGTILEEDEDNRMTSDEVQKKLEKILKAAHQNKVLLEQSCNQLRATCFGQDRYWRRYWHLPKAGGIFVEALESAQPEILKYHSKLEENHNQIQAAPTVNGTTSAEGEKRKRGRKRKSTAIDDGSAQSQSQSQSSGEKTEPETESEADETSQAPSVTQTQDKPQVETQSPTETKAEISVSASATIPIPNVNEVNSKATCELPATNDTAVNADKANTNLNNDDGMLDIEDSIPRAILVQKANKNDQTVVEVNNEVGCANVNLAANASSQPDNNITGKNENGIKNENEENCDIKPKLEDGMNQVTENGGPDVQITSDTASVSTIGAVKTEEGTVTEIKTEIKTENSENEVKDGEPIMVKWFSLANREMQLTSTEMATPTASQAAYSNITCDMILQCQGNRWDITNNAHYFHLPVEGPSNLKINKDSVLSLSGLDEEMMERLLNGEEKPVEDKVEPLEELQEEMEEKPDVKQEETQPFQLPPFLNMNFTNLSTFLQCDNPCPLQMTLDEQKMLEEVKLNGFPKKVENNFVPKELRHGWWKINDIETLNEIIQTLHVKGLRERELRTNLLQTLTESIDLSTPCHVANLRSPPPSKGYIHPEPLNAWNPQIARRVELSLLDQVESLEDKIASASMQVKGWTAPTRDPECENELDLVTGITIIRDRILGLEAAIERRYLKPPLGTR